MAEHTLPLQVGVKALLKNSEEKYLLLLRNPDKYPEVGAVWDIPGGRIDPGSSLMDNLRRELSEEVSLGLIGEPKLIAAQDILRPDKHVVRLTYVGTIDGAPTLNEDHTEFRWCTLDELRQLDKLDPFVKEILHLI